MNFGPGEPCHEPGQLELPALHDCEAFSNDGHVALVEITEGRRGLLTGDRAVYQLPGVSALLDCDLGDARQDPAILFERSSVSDDENFRVARYGEIVLNTHAAGTIGRRM